MIFVTGGTGLLGTHVLIELITRGEKVRALKRSSSDLSQVQSVFNFYFGSKGKTEFEKIDWVNGDLLDILSLQDGIRGCKIVYHCAAKVSFRKRDFRKMIKMNKYGTTNVVNVCLDQKVDHLCYVSSTAAIGRKNKQEYLDESNKWVNDASNSGYSVSKFLAEMEVWRGIEEGLNAVIVNPAMIIGPGNWNQSSISTFKVVKNGLKFYTPGMNAFVDARDVARIVADLSEKEIFNERFLLLSENLLFKDYFFQIADALKVKRPSIEVKPWMVGLAWRIESFLAIFGKKQNITRETARSSMAITKFSNQKIINKTGVEFTPIEASIENAANYFLAQ